MVRRFVDIIHCEIATGFGHVGFLVNLTN